MISRQEKPQTDHGNLTCRQQAARPFPETLGFHGRGTRRLTRRKEQGIAVGRRWGQQFQLLAYVLGHFAPNLSRKVAIPAS